MQDHTVLFVDDEVNILKALQRLLRHEPIQVLTASTPADAFDLIDRYEPQVVVSDQRMPRMNGVDFLSSVRERHGDVVRMMLTGYTDMTVAVEAINKGEIYRLITKPWNDDELKATLRQAFDHYDLKAEIKRLNQVTREQNFKLQDMNRNLVRRSASAPNSSTERTRSCEPPTSRRSVPSPRRSTRRMPTPAATPSASRSTPRGSPARCRCART
ncbi:MAG: response regulator [Myxococcota bacterium]